MSRRLPLLIATVLLATLSACSSGPVMSGGPEVTPLPTEARTVEAAQKVVQLSFDRFMGGDYAGAWDLYTAQGKAAISREDYVRLLTACPPPQVPYEVASARLDGDARAVVVVKVVGVAQSYEAVYEAGMWRFQPTKDALAGYARGADALIAEDKAKGKCG